MKVLILSFVILLGANTLVWAQGALNTTVCVLGDQKYSQGMRFAVDSKTTYVCIPNGIWQVNDKGNHTAKSACMYEGKLYGVGAVVSVIYNKFIKCGANRIWN